MEDIEVLGFIDNLNTEGKLEYGDYSDLYDTIESLILDHKAVIETMQNKIDELEKQIIEKDRLLFENEYGLV